jgi:hypothetical protein
MLGIVQVACIVHEPPYTAEAWLFLIVLLLRGAWSVVDDRTVSKRRRNSVGVFWIAVALILHRVVDVRIGGEFGEYWAIVFGVQESDWTPWLEAVVLGLVVPILLIAWGAWISRCDEDRPFFTDGWRPIRIREAKPAISKRPAWLCDEKAWQDMGAPPAGQRGS